MRHRLFLLLLLAAGVTAARDARAQLAGNQVYTAITPCRVVDTRIATPAAMLAPNVPRAFDVVGGTNLAPQGGNPGGCGIPGYGGSPATKPRVRAVMMNFVAVGPQGHGNLRAWASGEAPNASVLNYTPGVTIANGVAVPVDQDATPGADLLVRADVAGTHLVVDVLGYFRERHPQEGEGRPGAGVWGTGTDPQIFELCTGPTGASFGLSYSMVSGEGAVAACAAGSWVCSKAERGTAACNTQRPDGCCDALRCDGTWIDHQPAAHAGWLADVAGLAGTRFATASESGGTAADADSCFSYPVWCCTY